MLGAEADFERLWTEELESIDMLKDWDRRGTIDFKLIEDEEEEEEEEEEEDDEEDNEKEEGVEEEEEGEEEEEE